MLAALFRTPLLRWIGNLWWLPMVTGILLWAGWGEGDFRLLHLGFLAGCAAIGGFVVAAAAIDRSLALTEAARHHRAGHQFLCPECLHFGPFRYGCARCGEVPPLAVHVSRRCLRDNIHCAQCRLHEEKATAPPLEAYCVRCRSRVDLNCYHYRRVRVLGTLGRNDQRAVYEALDTSKGPKESSVCVCDDGARLTYVLPLDDLTDAARELREKHALHAVEAIWLDGEDLEPLALGQVVDRFIRQSGMSEEERRAITLYVRTETLPPPVEHLLSTRFGAIRYGVEAKALIEQGATGWGTAFLRQAHLEMPLAPADEPEEWRLPLGEGEGWRTVSTAAETERVTRRELLRRRRGASRWR